VLLGADPPAELASTVERYGRASVSPFVVEPGNVGFRVPNGVAGYRAVRRWAVFATGPVAPIGFEADALAGVLEHVAAARRVALFAAVPDPEPFLDHGMHATPIADDALVALPDFSLAGKRRAGIRHSVSSAARAGLRVVPYTPDRYAELARVSEGWLRTKRGGELGFTLGTFDAAHLRRTECRVAVDADDAVVGFVTWRRFDDGRGRVLDLMRRTADAPNPTMDLLVATSLIEYAASGVAVASLGSVPRSHGAVGEHFYAAGSLRRYKDKFAPAWMPMWLVVPSARRFPSALRALATAYCPHGLLRAIRRNG
jgi:lysylphosphatidylglycerol synthetase-like protein (DUF2156 family)